MDTTAAPAPKPTPWDKKTERLGAAIARVDGEIAAVNARYAEKIGHHNDAVETCTRVAVAAEEVVQHAEGRLLGCNDLVASLLQQLDKARRDRVDADRALAEAQIENEAARQRLANAEHERGVKLVEPTRHLAALEHDKRRLQARLDLHRARAPRPALFG